jgi:hypothetical protein
MGGSSYSDYASRNLYSSRSSLVDDIGADAARAKVFVNKTPAAVKAAGMDPATIKVREARDSAAHPNSNAIGILFDVTGSMGGIPAQFATDKNKMPALMRLLIEHAYIDDPQIMFGAIGDAYSDRSPLQLGQFESGLEMDEWLTKLFLEGGGGGSRRESYEMAVWWAANHVSMDCLEKRGKKGYLFTMGDEMAYETLPREIVKKWLGDTIESELTLSQIIAAVQEKFEYFHIYVEQGTYPSSGAQGAKHVRFWKEQIGERLLILRDIDHVAELIGSTIGVCEGRGLDDIAGDLAKAGLDHKAADDVKGAIVPYSRTTGRDLAKAGTVSGDLPGGVGTGASTRI